MHGLLKLENVLDHTVVMSCKGQWELGPACMKPLRWRCLLWHIIQAVQNSVGYSIELRCGVLHMAHNLTDAFKMCRRWAPQAEPGYSFITFITRFPIRRSGALQQAFYGSPPTCPVL